MDEIRRFEEQHRQRPESLVFARLADAYRKAGQPERALEVLAEGLERHPDYASGHIVRARTLRDLGRPDEAAAAFHRVLELDGENLVAVRELGQLADQRGDLRGAKRWYELLAAVDPASEDAAARLAELEAALGATSGDEAPAAESAPEPSEAPDHTESEESEWWSDPVNAGWAGPAEEEPEAGDEPLQEDDAIAAILNGEVPRTIGAEDGWWYEERLDEAPPEPSPEADLLTRTMADLYSEQGLFSEAAEIYEELLRDSPEDAELQARLATMREKMAGRATSAGVTEPAEEHLDLPRAGPPVGEELRSLLRRGERNAASLPDPPVAPDGDEDLPSEDVAPEESDFARYWISDLRDRS